MCRSPKTCLDFPFISSAYVKSQKFVKLIEIVKSISVFKRNGCVLKIECWLNVLVHLNLLLCHWTFDQVTGKLLLDCMAIGNIKLWCAHLCIFFRAHSSTKSDPCHFLFKMIIRFSMPIWLCFGAQCEMMLEPREVECSLSVYSSQDACYLRNNQSFFLVSIYLYHEIQFFSSASIYSIFLMAYNKSGRF